MIILDCHDGMLEKFSKEEFIQVLVDYASSQEASEDQKTKISEIIAGIPKLDFYLRCLDGEHPLVSDVILRTPPADNLIQCLTDVVAYQQGKDLFENRLEAIRPLIAIKSTRSEEKPPPRPPKIIKLCGGKK